MPLAQINAMLREIKGTRLLNQKITCHQEANVITARTREQEQKELYVLLFLNVFSSLMRTLYTSKNRWKWTYRVLRYYSTRVRYLIHVQITANVRS